MRHSVLCITVMAALLFSQLTACQTAVADTESPFEKGKYSMEQDLLASSIHGSTYDRNIDIIFDADSDFRYFCTPLDAYVFASTGGDGVHFCTIPDHFGDMVFVVEPIPLDEIHVRPVAENFIDFIRVLLAVRFTGILLDIPLRSEAEFREGLQIFREQHETEEHTERLRHLAAYYGVTPMDDPYTYVRNLQNDFDYDLIPFSDDYYESCGIPNPNK